MPVIEEIEKVRVENIWGIKDKEKSIDDGVDLEQKNRKRKWDKENLKKAMEASKKSF